jgi:outer membrane immunogenic protein
MTTSAAAIVVALFCGSAFAADLPSVKSAPAIIPPPSPLWTGFYGGINIGGSFGGGNVSSSARDLFDDSVGLSVFAVPTAFGAASAAAASNSASLNNSGIIGGGQIGYNYQFYERFVAGLEADIQGTNLSSTTTALGGAVEGATGVPFLSASTYSRKLDYLGTVRGRVGYLVTPTLLVYATGGLAWANVGLSNSLFQTGLDPLGRVGASQTVGAFNDTRTGWTAGAGAEWMFLPNWSAKLEYLYYDLGNVNTYVGAAGVDPAGAALYAAALNSSTRFDGHIVRVGVNYHFHWGAAAPVLAKY